MSVRNRRRLRRTTAAVSQCSPAIAPSRRLLRCIRLLPCQPTISSLAADRRARDCGAFHRAAAKASRGPGQAALRKDFHRERAANWQPDDEIPAEVLEFFVPEVEEHLQTITDCLLALEANPNEEDIHRLFRSMHTIKGSAAQVGWQRIATIAHRAEDLVGRLRDGELKPSATIIDLCLESVDVLKKLIYRQWEDEASFQLAARTLIARLDHIAPAET